MKVPSQDLASSTTPPHYISQMWLEEMYFGERNADHGQGRVHLVLGCCRGLTRKRSGVR